ncbi:DUF4304 domain-containing protein [Arthrobacter sp. NPDC090010]|uniref:DUF4304 domain-containing protein n=1 Tax=Arthrobacter sp. NPDC090010 TaxID=3363942 RepID=UPI00382FCAE8
MTDLETRFNALIADVVVPELKARGYRKRKLVWTRQTPEALHEIAFQRSQGNASDHVRFYVEIGAYVPEFAHRTGNTVPEDLLRATTQYRRRFESVVDWPGQWVDLEAWTDQDLAPALRSALLSLDEHLSGITTAAAMAAALRSGGPLNLELFAWWCATDDDGERDAQLAAAEAEFGREDRWPRLYAQFERVAARYGITLPAASA